MTMVVGAKSYRGLRGLRGWRHRREDGTQLASHGAIPPKAKLMRQLNMKILLTGPFSIAQPKS